MSRERIDEIQAARERLRGIAHVTPIATSRTLDERAGGPVFLKCENLQRVGAFKIRGAYNALSLIPPERRAAGVLTFSSGNHAQGIALAGRLLGISTTVVMPLGAPASKKAATLGYGARVVEFDPATTNREEFAAGLPEAQTATIVPPYDHLDVIAGQGTVALEMMVEQTGPLDLLLVPCGGGGLLSGSAIAARAVAPGCQVIGIEPELADDATRSFRTGTLQTVHNPPTIADGTRTPSLGKHTFPLVLEYAAGMETVSEEEIKAAVRFLFYRLKLVVEPSGALGVAALLAGKIDGAGRKVGVILSGGNIDGATMAAILLEGE
ncbi:MAG TPA: pyridoxal-phosphate dependent enzyme [Thermoanaerobaculia bacterium]|nr:pyridoxal-phosphate dependent enzyme [Thermoanaerobaculia bacterium]